MNKQQKTEKRRLLSGVVIRVLLLLGAVLLLIAGTLAWFDARRSAATVTIMGKPSDLAIVGPNESELRLDMSPTDGKVNADGTVTVSRLFGVKTRSDHWLEVARTTNTDNFSFQLFAAVEDANGDYTYNPDSPIAGDYLNAKASTDATKTADPAIAPFYADNFVGQHDSVQVNAVPLYWMSEKQNAPTSGVAYYYIEFTWNEADKETDVYYILAGDFISN